jgi:protein TonB
VKRRAAPLGAGILFPAALGVSALAHLLLLFALPYSPARPAARPPELFPVGIIVRPAPPPPAAPRQPAPRAAPAVPRLEPAPVAAPEPQPAAPTQPEPQAEESPAPPPLELAPAQPAAVQPSGQATGEPPAEAQNETAAAPEAVQGTGSGELAAEVSATQAVLSSLRSRIAGKIRYPALARANGWKGTVLLEAMLDGQGRLQGLAVRRSSGYTVLDRAAASLVRSVTPVANPLGRPLRIEIPIVYELKD